MEEGLCLIGRLDLAAELRDEEVVFHSVCKQPTGGLRRPEEEPAERVLRLPHEGQLRLRLSQFICQGHITLPTTPQSQETLNSTFVINPN